MEKKVKGAFDKMGEWWFENDIKCFTNGVVKMAFELEKKDIKIIEVPYSQIKKMYENR